MSAGATAFVPTEQAKSHRREDQFYWAMATAAILAAIAGFAPSLVETSARRAPVSTLVIVHGLLCVAWLVLFLTQISLVATRRVSVHRRLGVAAGVLATALVVVGYSTAIILVRRGFDLSGDLHLPASDAAFQMVFALGDLVTFSVLVVAGYMYRRRGAVHKRLMLMATLGGLMPASFAHFIGHVPALARVRAPIILIPLVAFFFAGAVFERLSRGRIHPVFLWVPIALVVWANMRAAIIGPSAAWHHFVFWLAR